MSCRSLFRAFFMFSPFNQFPYRKGRKPLSSFIRKQRDSLEKAKKDRGVVLYCRMTRTDGFVRTMRAIFSLLKQHKRLPVHLFLDIVGHRCPEGYDREVIDVHESIVKEFMKKGFIYSFHSPLLDCNLPTEGDCRFLPEDAVLEMKPVGSVPAKWEALVLTP